jgi:DNA-binding GntR family transcriptional regulator
MVPQPKLRQPSHLRLVDDVYQSLENAILSGSISPGERLVEARIAEELNVSRTTVREAFLKLEIQRLIVNNPRRGTYVTRLSEADALDLGYARAVIESFAVTIGLARLDEQDFATLEQHLAEMGTCALPAELPRLIKIDLAFHGLLVESAHSSQLMNLWSSLNGQIGALFIRGIENQHARTEDIVALHQQLYEAVRTSESRVVQRAVLEHYVRIPHDNANHEDAIFNTLQTIAPMYRVGSIEEASA